MANATEDLDVTEVADFPDELTDRHCDHGGDCFRQQRGDGVANLCLYRVSTPNESEIVREGKKPLEARGSVTGGCPNGRGRRQARLRLDRRRRPIGGELEQEGPIAAPPLEHRVWMAPLGCVVEIVVTCGDPAQEVAPSATYDFFRLGQRDKTRQGLPRRYMGPLSPPVARRSQRPPWLASGSSGSAVPFGVPTTKSRGRSWGTPKSAALRTAQRQW